MAQLEIVTAASRALVIWLEYDPATLAVSAVGWANSLPNAQVTVKGRTVAIPVGTGSSALQGKPTHLVEEIDPGTGEASLILAVDFTIFTEASA